MADTPDRLATARLSKRFVMRKRLHAAVDRLRYRYHSRDLPDGHPAHALIYRVAGRGEEAIRRKYPTSLMATPAELAAEAAREATDPLTDLSRGSLERLRRLHRPTGVRTPPA